MITDARHEQCSFSRADETLVVHVTLCEMALGLHKIHGQPVPSLDGDDAVVADPQKMHI